jgi:DNA repair photolyase
MSAPRSPTPPGDFSAAPRAARKGRGAASNTDGRFEPYRHEAADDGWGEPEAVSPVRTTVGIDRARSIISHNDSPDIPFEQSINPYRGCEHGCVYCYARPSHTYLGLSAGLDFESRLFTKPDAAALLTKELRAPGYKPSVIALGANTDPYQPIERRYGVTRSILEVLAACEHPVVIITKSARIEQDLDLLASMAQKNLVQVFISITTLKTELARRLEPRASAPARRVQALRTLSEAGVSAGVLVAPIIPVITDGEIESILEAARAAGARAANYTLLRLPHEIKDLFKEWLSVHAPLAAAHVMTRIREARAGKENDPRFGSRMRGEGAYADMIRHRFRLARDRLGLSGRDLVQLDVRRFRPPPAAGDQMDMF